MNTLLTLRPGRKNGIRISTTLYDAIKREIVKVLFNTEDVTVPLLFEVLHSLFIEKLGENTGWYIYHVKLDMEARGLIKCQRLKDSVRAITVIRIVMKNFKKEEIRNSQSGITVL